MNESKLNYVNYGDIGIVDGGFFIAKDESAKNCYYFIAIHINEDMQHYEIRDCYIDLKDEWIEWNAILEDDKNEDDATHQHIMSAYHYYGYQEFQGEKEIKYNEDEVLQYLKDEYNIIKNVRYEYFNSYEDKEKRMDELRSNSHNLYRDYGGGYYLKVDSQELWSSDSDEDEILDFIQVDKTWITKYYELYKLNDTKKIMNMVEKEFSILK